MRGKYYTAYSLIFLIIAIDVLIVLVNNPSEAAFLDYSRQLGRVDDEEANLKRALLFVALVQKVIPFLGFPQNLQIFNFLVFWSSLAFVYFLAGRHLRLNFAGFAISMKIAMLVISPSMLLLPYGISREGLSIALVVLILSVNIFSNRPYTTVAFSALCALLIYFLRDVDIIAAFIAFVSARIMRPLIINEMGPPHGPQHSLELL